MSEPRFSDLRKAADQAHELWTRAARAKTPFLGAVFAKAYEAIEGVFAEAGLRLEVGASGATWEPLERSEAPQ